MKIALKNNGTTFRNMVNDFRIHSKCSLKTKDIFGRKEKRQKFLPTAVNLWRKVELWQMQ